MCFEPTFAQQMPTLLTVIAFVQILNFTSPDDVRAAPQVIRNNATTRILRPIARENVQHICRDKHRDASNTEMHQTTSTLHRDVRRGPKVKQVRLAMFPKGSNPLVRAVNEHSEVKHSTGSRTGYRIELNSLKVFPF